MNESVVADDPGSVNGAAPAPSGAWRRPALLLALGSFALAAGLLVYLADRDSARSTLIPAVGALAGSHLFGALGLWLPSFVHPFAFSLYTAAALPPRAAPRYGACIAWGAMNVAFEIGQHPQLRGPLAEALHGGCGQTPLAQPLASYFLRGTFDRLDIVAALSGALAAAVVLRWIHRNLKTDHAS